jgi:ABC-type nickel/cobalt efflux system permease component RcnA
MRNSADRQGKNNGSSLGVLAVLAAVIFIAAIAGPGIHAAETIARIAAEAAALTLIAVTGTVMLVITSRIMIRHHHKAHDRADTRSHPQQVHPWLGTGTLPRRRASGGFLQLVHRQPEMTATRPEPGAGYQDHSRKGCSPAGTATLPEDDARRP